MKTSQTLKLMKVVSWIIFIGICIKVGAILISFTVSLFASQEATRDLFIGLDLSNIYSYSTAHYVAFGLILLSLFAIQAYVFFLVVKLFSRLDERKPFNQPLSDLISKIGYVSLLAGFVALIGTGMSRWLDSQRVTVNFDWSAEEFLFMGCILFIVSLFYKRGVEIQSENELTV